MTIPYKDYKVVHYSDIERIYLEEYGETLDMFETFWPLITNVDWYEPIYFDEMRHSEDIKNRVYLLLKRAFPNDDKILIDTM